MSASVGPVVEQAVERLREVLGEEAVSARVECGQTIVTLPRERLLEALTLLRDHEALGFRVLADLTAVDYLTTGREPRFDVVYQLLSREHVARLRVIVPVEEGDETLPSATPVFPAANWLEREAFDLMGLRFTGHPDLKRIELPEDYDGHPLRRDFPVRGGHRQVRADEEPEPRFGHRYRVR
jgi:NADH-quinone oxidoreductase subunit C